MIQEKRKHYCIICKKIEECKDDFCNFTAYNFSHFQCFANLTDIERVRHEEIVTCLKGDHNEID